jgi:hypothetical protein
MGIDPSSGAYGLPTVSAGKPGGTGTLASGIPPNGTIVYRVWGDKSHSDGRSWTTIDPSTVPNYRDAAGLPETNTGRFVSVGKLVDNTGITTRPALPLDGNRGGMSEIIIPNPNNQVRLSGVYGLNPEY